MDAACRTSCGSALRSSGATAGNASGMPPRASCRKRRPPTPSRGPHLGDHSIRPLEPGPSQHLDRPLLLRRITERQLDQTVEGASRQMAPHTDGERAAFGIGDLRGDFQQCVRRLERVAPRLACHRPVEAIHEASGVRAMMLHQAQPAFARHAAIAGMPTFRPPPSLRPPTTPVSPTPTVILQSRRRVLVGVRRKRASRLTGRHEFDADARRGEHRRQVVR